MLSFPAVTFTISYSALIQRGGGTGPVKPRQPSRIAKGCQFRQIYLEDEGGVARRGWHSVTVRTAVAVVPAWPPHTRLDIL
ncbi:MAG: hypothetical protein JWO42_999 [Chloroflexi bacterium]|nr:hypothetical protein [Chloroflexota bacterium]